MGSNIGDNTEYVKSTDNTSDLLLYSLIGVVISIICISILSVIIVIQYKKLKRKTTMDFDVAASDPDPPYNENSEGPGVNEDEPIITKGNDLVLLNNNKAFKTPGPPPRKIEKNNEEDDGQNNEHDEIQQVIQEGFATTCNENEVGINQYQIQLALFSEDGTETI